MIKQVTSNANSTNDKAALKYIFLFKVFTALIIDITERKPLKNIKIRRGKILPIPLVLPTVLIIQMAIEQAINANGTGKKLLTFCS